MVVLQARAQLQETFHAPVQREREHCPAAPLIDAGEFRGGGPERVTIQPNKRADRLVATFRLCSRLGNTAAE